MLKKEAKKARDTCDVSRTPQRIFARSCAFTSYAAAKRRFIAIQRGRRIAYPSFTASLWCASLPILGCLLMSRAAYSAPSWLPLWRGSWRVAPEGVSPHFSSSFFNAEKKKQKRLGTLAMCPEPRSAFSFELLRVHFLRRRKATFYRNPTRAAHRFPSPLPCLGEHRHSPSLAPPLEGWDGATSVRQPSGLRTAPCQPSWWRGGLAAGATAARHMRRISPTWLPL